MTNKALSDSASRRGLSATGRIIRAVLVIGFCFAVGGNAATSPVKRPGDVCKLQSDITAWGLEANEDMSGANPVASGSPLAAEPEPVDTPALSRATNSCGMHGQLIDQLGTSALSVPVGNGTGTDAYIPVYMADKFPGRFTCSAIKPRIACVAGMRTTAEGTWVKLRSLPIGPSATEDEILVPKQGGRASNRVDSNFVLLRKYRSNRSVNVLSRVAQSVEAENCTGISTSDCRSKRGYRAELSIIKYIRMERFPWQSDTQRDADTAGFFRAYAQLTGDEELVHIAMARSEIGFVPGPPMKSGSSPYYLLDAAVASSGPSFGPFQVDVATNDGAEDLSVFREALARVARRENDPKLINVSQRLLFEQPIRQYTVEQLALFHKYVPAISAEIAQSDLSARIARSYSNFLARAAARMTKLKLGEPAFADSLFMRLFIVDTANVRGAGEADALVKFAHATLLPSEPVASRENAMISEALRRAGTPDNKSVVCDRVRNIRSTILAYDPEITAIVPAEGSPLPPVAPLCK
jgi:hypothetical protein